MWAHFCYNMVHWGIFWDISISPLRRRPWPMRADSTYLNNETEMLSFWWNFNCGWSGNCNNAASDENYIKMTTFPFPWNLLQFSETIIRWIFMGVCPVIYSPTKSLVNFQIMLDCFTNSWLTLCLLYWWHCKSLYIYATKDLSIINLDSQQYDRVPLWTPTTVTQRWW